MIVPKQDGPVIIAFLAMAFGFTLIAAKQAMTIFPWEPFWVFATFAATAALAIYARKQLIEFRRSNERQLRAYVSVVEAGLEEIDVGKSPYAVVTLKNFGQTPAKHFRQAAMVGLFKYPLDQTPPTLLDTTCATSIVGPGGTLAVYPRLKEVLSKGDMDRLTAGQFALFVYGEYDYLDIFGHPQTGNFCLFSGGGQVRLGNLASTATPLNDAT